MYGQHSRFRPTGGGRGAALPPALHLPQSFIPNPSPYFQNPNIYPQNPSFPTSHNPYLQTPTFPPQQSPNAWVRPRSFSPKPSETLEKIERAVAKARHDLLLAGESVSSWKVSQSALLSLQVDSWNSLGFQLQEIPFLYRIIVTEGKVNAFIHCFVAVRRITSLHDLDVAICNNEGIERFEELQMGPLLRHPLVVHYFSVPSDATEVIKITSEEIIYVLCEFMDTHEDKYIRAEELLDFLAMKQSVAVKEKLGVRIQSLSMHITSIREARKAEDATLKRSLQTLKQKPGKQTRKLKGELPQCPVIFSKKKELDRRFTSISQRIQSFSSMHEDFVGKHIKFVSSSSEDEDSDDINNEDNKDDIDLSTQRKISSQNRKSCDQRLSTCPSSQNRESSDQRSSTCPYPSATEEMLRLGLKPEMDGHTSLASGILSCDESKGSSGRKRKSETLSCKGHPSPKFPKRDKVKLNEVELDLHPQENYCKKKDHNHLAKVCDLMHTNNSLEMFITTWKEACREPSVAKVFDRMLNYYKATARQKRKMKSLFSIYPFIGLLNVAVTSIRFGMWDSLYDTFQAVGHQGLTSHVSDPYTEFERIDVEPSEKAAVLISEPISKLGHGVTVEDIIEKVAMYFELDHAIPREGKSPLERQFIFLKELHKCEIWLTEQYSVKEFNSLGHGEFFMFLEKYASLLPNALLESLSAELSEKSFLEISMLQHQLVLLLSQAASSLQENDVLTKQHISVLLRKQFPVISFKIMENDSMEDLLDIVRKQKSSITSSCILFSVTLFKTCCVEDSLVHNEKDLLEATGLRADLSQRAGTLGSVTARDAIECLLKAPMLSDLQSWSHWDHIFAPSLGPLVGWLLNEVHNKDLLCLVTRDGKVIRVDHSATVDAFLEASVQGSSFQTAVKLISLFSLYGGERHVPLSLLKCHARQSIEVILKNSMESIEINTNGNSVMHGEAFRRQKLLDQDCSSSPLIVDSPGTIVHVKTNSRLCKSLCRINEAVPVASRFILDCLGYLPSEFRSFAADVLLSGLCFVIKDAPSAILRECNQIEQRFMLHEVGLSLGISEWIADYHAFCSATSTDLFVSSGTSSLNTEGPAFSMGSKDTSENLHSDGKMMVVVEADGHNEAFSEGRDGMDLMEVSYKKFGNGGVQRLSELNEDQDATAVIESIRREEFGLDPSLTHMESSMLKKQHARLGRALHCLSQELYSQDSHFLLELVQNADDNIYPEKVEPTLVFILQPTGIIVLNNEQGFSAQNIKALCDVGNSTKKGSTGGYIGQKGIGFKSVFRVTDAPEIHSNGFHVKFDISEGQIGFVLPTVVPPCDVDLFRRLVSSDVDQTDAASWNTCIVIPFRSKLLEGTSMNSIMSMFSDLHPSLLLFLHRLQCITFRNMLNDSLIVLRRETLGDGIVKVSHGKEKMSWFVATQKLQASALRSDVQTTEIAIAFTLQESDNGGYKPHLDLQPVFAFLPLRTYGLKFILQGDFVLPSSREEVDGDSAWNQWLLSEFPGLFVSAGISFCVLPCFQENPGKAVAAYMSFVPLMGEVHGFFCNLPRLIISKLRMSNCLLLEGDNKEWVPPCKVLRSWNEQARVLLPEGLLYQHLGLGYLDKDIILSDPLAKALGVEEYGPKILIDIIASICNTENGIKSMGLGWLSSWLNALYSMLAHSSGQTSLNADIESDLIKNLIKTPFIPLSDGTYGSVAEGTIWLPSDAFGSGFEGEHGPEAFQSLYAKLRTVSPGLLSAAAVVTSSMDEIPLENLNRMLLRIGVQRLSAHEIIRVHILTAISDDRMTNRDKKLMTEYLSFIMLHLQSGCSNCRIEREHIISELRNKALILTNHGYKRPVEVSIHFSREFGNPVDLNKINATDSKWNEVDITYLKHPSTQSLSSGLIKWREFFQELGVTDFVKIVPVERSFADLSHTALKNMMWDRDLMYPGSIAKDWESPELAYILSILSSSKNRERCKYLLEVLDKLWDDCFSSKVTGFCIFKSTEDSKPFNSSFINSIHDVQWIVSSMDDELHYPKDLFYDCDAVRSILGAFAPYAVPKVRSEKLLSDIGFKTQVTLADALKILQVWSRSKTPFRASLAQMSKFYTFIWNEIATSKGEITEEFRSVPSIFVPFAYAGRHEDVVSGIFLSPEELYWHDSTGSVEKMKELLPQRGALDETHCPLSKTLSYVYPSLHDFFVKECGVWEIPPFRCYLRILLQLSSIALPSQAANAVFRVLLKWANDLKSGLVSSDDIVYLRECLLKFENTVFPTVQDKWVSLHPSFGLVCWCDDEELRKQFKHSDNIDFLYFSELNDDEKELLRAKVAVLMQAIGIPALSEVITREAICYGTEDCNEKALLVDWVFPYAQRYIYNLHPDRYFQLKQSGFEKLNHLQIVVVEKLFYRHIIKGCDSESKKRFECSCLLQGNILYMTRASDSHSIFLELSRLFFNGTPELHLANFLHMVTTMAESGSSEEQMEFFILNSQKVPKLPDEESVWFLPLRHNDETSQTIYASTMIDEENPSKSRRKPGINRNWPPVDWKTAPDFSLARASGLRTRAMGWLPSGSSEQEVKSEGSITHTEGHGIPIGIGVDWIIQDDSAATTTALVLQDLRTTEDKPLSMGSFGPAYRRVDSSLDMLKNPSDSVTVPYSLDMGPLTFNESDQLSFIIPNENQAAITGRLGEHVAFKYFSEKVGDVKWVNEEMETGLPYDIVIGKKEESKEYVEVKATKSAKKDWFMISTREWQFAVEKGESFSIVHVVLVDTKNARVTVFKNPIRLCQQGVLQLAVLMPKQQKELSIVT